MENVLKALLIAAAVLIVILLIAFGIKIFNSAGNTSADAQATGDVIVSKTADAKAEAILAIIDYVDDKKFNAYIEKNYLFKNVGAISLEKAEELCALVVKRTQKITGKIYESYETHIASDISSKIRCVGPKTDNARIYVEVKAEKYKVVWDARPRKNEDTDENYSIFFYPQ